jgi:hypothetical protein
MVWTSLPKPRSNILISINLFPYYTLRNGQLAKIHAKIISNLRAIFIADIQDIWNISMNHTTETGIYPLFHPVHNKGKPMVKDALTTQEAYDAALDRFGVIHSDLMSHITPEYHNQHSSHPTYW